MDSERLPVNFVDGKGADVEGNVGNPATADFGFIFRRFVDQFAYVNGVTRDKELRKDKDKLSFQAKGHDDSDRAFQDIHPDDPNPKDAGKALVIIDCDAPNSITKDPAFFFNNRTNFREYIVFNYLKKSPERCSSKLKWAFSSDTALGGKSLFGDEEDGKTIFIFGLPNDNLEDKKNSVNEVLIEGQGGITTGEVPSLKLELSKPEVKEVLGKKDLVAGKTAVLAVDGDNLIGQYILRSKKNPKTFILADKVQAEPKGAPQFSPLKNTSVVFSPPDAFADEFEFVIVNEAGESKPVGGFKIVKGN